MPETKGSDIDFTPDNYHRHYDEILPNLFLGDQVSPQQFTGQLSLIVNCTISVKFPSGSSFKRIRIPITDDPSDCDDLRLFLRRTTCLTDIYHALKNGRNVLVHCQKGRQRSAAVVACYLIKYHKMNPDGAVSYINGQRPVAFCEGVTFQTTIDQMYFDCSTGIHNTPTFQTDPFRVLLNYITINTTTKPEIIIIKNKTDDKTLSTLVTNNSISGERIITETMIDNSLTESIIEVEYVGGLSFPMPSSHDTPPLDKIENTNNRSNYDLLAFYESPNRVVQGTQQHKQTINEMDNTFLELIPGLFIGQSNTNCIDSYQLVVDSTVDTSLNTTYIYTSDTEIPLVDESTALYMYLKNTSCLRAIHETIGEQVKAIIFNAKSLEIISTITACYFIACHELSPSDAIMFLQSKYPNVLNSTSKFKSVLDLIYNDKLTNGINNCRLDTELLCLEQ